MQIETGNLTSDFARNPKIMNSNEKYRELIQSLPLRKALKDMQEGRLYSIFGQTKRRGGIFKSCPRVPKLSI